MKNIKKWIYYKNNRKRNLSINIEDNNLLNKNISMDDFNEKMYNYKEQINKINLKTIDINKQIPNQL